MYDKLRVIEAIAAPLHLSKFTVKLYCEDACRAERVLNRPLKHSFTRFHQLNLYEHMVLVWHVRAISSFPICARVRNVIKKTTHAPESPISRNH